MPKKPTTSDAGGSTAGRPPYWLTMGGPFAEYVIDATQRTILFWDVLRQRSTQYCEHKAMQVPHVLSFDAELVLDGRSLERPANYLLVRVKPPEGVVIDHKKRPFVVVDPRVGHGPGIGGFKADSEIGVAVRAGHSCYFIGFTPDPLSGQTIEDVMRAEEVFLEKVIELHPEAEGKRERRGQFQHSSIFCYSFIYGQTTEIGIRRCFVSRDLAGGPAGRHIPG